LSQIFYKFWSFAWGILSGVGDTVWYTVKGIDFWPSCCAKHVTEMASFNVGCLHEVQSDFLSLTRKLCLNMYCSLLLLLSESDNSLLSESASFPTTSSLYSFPEILLITWGYCYILKFLLSCMVEGMLSSSWQGDMSHEKEVQVE